MRSVVLPFVGLLLLLNACGKKDTLSPGCANAGALVKQVKNQSGVVYHDSTQSRYFIRVPNSFDSYDLGYTCNLAAEYQKNGLKVRFSGLYYRNDNYPGFLAGDKSYYLTLTSVEEQ